MSEIEGRAIEEIAALLFTRLKAMQTQLCQLKEADWRRKFIRACRLARKELEHEWEASWQDICNGKRLFASLQERVRPKMPLRQFKKRVMLGMRSGARNNWRAIERLVKALVDAPAS